VVCPKSPLRKLRSETFLQWIITPLSSNALHGELLNLKGRRFGVRVRGTNSTSFGFACIKKFLTGLIRERPSAELLLTFKLKTSEITPRVRKTGSINNQMRPKRYERSLPYGSGRKLRCFSGQNEKGPRMDAKTWIGVVLQVPAGINPNVEKIPGNQ
jgi:hypothetical protein